MDNTKLIRAFEKESGIHVMVPSCSSLEKSESEYFLLNESTIRKETGICDEPEFIILLSTDSEFIGLFKKLHVADSNSAVCWSKVY